MEKTESFGEKCTPYQSPYLLNRTSSPARQGLATGALVRFMAANMALWLVVVSKKAAGI